MNSDSKQMLKHVAIAFLVVLVLYISLFIGDNHLRTRKGPWRVEFFATNEAPAIRVDHKALGISSVVLVFQDEALTNQNFGTVLFSHPKQPLPFGHTKFEDLTYLPGSVAFDFYGHEVELLPRTLQINKRERGWPSGTTILLFPHEKLPPESFYDPKKKKRRFAPAQQ